MPVCGSGGVALEKNLGLKVKGSKLKVRSFHPEGWTPPTIPKTYFEGIKRASGEIWLNACRPETSCYDSPEGGFYTNAFAKSFSPDKSLSKIMKKTGRKLVKQGIPAVPVMVCSPGRQKFKLK